MKFEKWHLPNKSKNVSDWYNTVVMQAELADYGPAKGTMIFRPYGYQIWELIQQALGREMKARGIENAYFPLFIPESLLKKEKEHVQGFSPELAVVTIGGGEELKEKLVVRPTSETIMYEAYSRWIQSWRDLPMLINQWNNVVRWEKRTYLFLRTTEFLWQEGHTAHATHEECWDQVLWAIRTYQKVLKEYLAVPGYIGKKSNAEKFAGADVSTTFEALMPDGKSLQTGTSHDLGQNFSKPFDIQFTDQEGTQQYVWQTSWGLSTRAIGGMIMLHGDDQGLRLPPRLAPIEAIVLPVKYDKDILAFSKKVCDELLGNEIRAKIDVREDQSFGYRINKWELKGIPLRIEIGSKEVESKTITAVRRDTGEKVKLPFKGVSKRIQELLNMIQDHMFAEAEKFLKKNTHTVDSYHEFKKIMAGPKGFLKVFWCEDPTCETKIKETTKATSRCLPLDAKEEKGVCISCGTLARHRWYFAQAY